MPISLPSDTIQGVAAASPANTSAATARVDASARPTPEAFVKFEAMVLQTFMQSILPSDSESVYGGGMAGDMWKSMLAQQLGEVMARRGGIGIADRILGDHYLQGEDKIPLSGVSQGPAKENSDRQELLSAALVEQAQRDIVKSLHEDISASAINSNARATVVSRPSESMHET